VAKLEAFEAEAAKGVTDEQVAAYYEKNKTTQFRKRPEENKDAAIEPATPETKAEEKPGATKPDDKQPVEAKPASEAAPPAPPAVPPQGRVRGSATVTPVAFRRRSADESPKPDAESKSEGEKKPEDGKEPAGEKKPDADKKTDADVQPAVDLEPLEKVRDEIRRTLARQAADDRLDAVFAAVSRDVDRYATDLALWRARGKANGAPEPSPPDIDVIAKKQGLEASRSGLVTAVEAARSGPIGTSGEMIVDPTSRFGVRRQRWLDTMFGPGAAVLRPSTSRDAEGNRYISWATEDQPEYVPSFEQAREKVERRWREVEARGRARARAEELAKQASAGQKPLAEVAKAAGLEAHAVGPFTWLTQGTAPFGAAPRLSTPEGIDKPGEEFMRAVFALEPGETAAAFNEPRTICYAVRLTSFEPALETLRERFVAGRKDQRRLAMVGRQQMSSAFGEWFEAFEKRQGIEWRREPR
jgi:hypothetical protein